MSENLKKKRKIRKMKEITEKNAQLESPIFKEKDAIFMRKKKQEIEISQKYFQENSERKALKRKMRDLEKSENLLYQKEFGEEMDFREEKRKLFIKEKAAEVEENKEKARNYDKEALEPKKHAKIVKGFEKAGVRENELFCQKVTEEKERKLGDFKDLKEILELQIKEKKMKELIKKKDRGQQEIWEENERIYKEIEEKKNKEKRKIREDWAFELKKQMMEKEEERNRYRNRMSQEEGRMNKGLLDELKGLKIKI